MKNTLKNIPISLLLKDQFYLGIKLRWPRIVTDLSKKPYTIYLLVTKGKDVKITF